MFIIKFGSAFLGSSLFLNSLATGAEYRLDSTYATSGIFQQTGGAIKGVIVQPTGKILLAATMTEASRSQSSFALLRQNSNGTLDDTFGDNGIRFASFGSSSSASVTGMATSPLDGKIFLVGSSSGFNFSSGSAVFTSDFAVAGFESDGSPNTGFNSTGKTTTSFDSVVNQTKTFSYGSSGAECVAVQTDGKVVVGGWAEVGTGSRRFVVLRYLTTGSIDPSFGGGYALTDPGSYCTISAIAISSDDQRIFAAGFYQDPVSYAYKIMVACYKANGTLDTTFDTDGIVITGSGNQNHKASSVAIQADGKVVVGGETFIKNPFAEPEDFALFRYLSTGAPDTDFGTGGFVAVDAVGGYDRLSAIRLQSGGKILAGGTVGGDPQDPSGVGSFALLMFNGNGTLDTDFGTGGMVTTTGPSTRSIQCLTQQTDGKIIAGGEFWGSGGNPGESAAIRYEAVPVVIPTTRKTDLLLGLTNKVKLGSNIYNTTGVGQTQPLAIGFKSTESAFIGIQNDGSAPDSFKVSATPGNLDFTVKYFKGATNITSQIVAGTYQTASLAPNASEILKVVATARSLQTAEKRTLTITASSAAKPSAIDKALIKVTSSAKPK